jgi:hypothetical protein
MDQLAAKTSRNITNHNKRTRTSKAKELANIKATSLKTRLKIKRECLN